MFKLRSIAVRLIMAISLTVAVACGILGTFSIVQQRALTQLALDQQLKLQYDSVIAALDYEGRAALAVSAVIANAAAGRAMPSPRAIATGCVALLGGPMKAMKAQGFPLISSDPAAGDDLLCASTTPRHLAMTSRRAATPS